MIELYKLRLTAFLGVTFYITSTEEMHCVAFTSVLVGNEMKNVYLKNQNTNINKI